MICTDVQTFNVFGVDIQKKHVFYITCNFIIYEECSSFIIFYDGINLHSAADENENIVG
jgi:hypothetical protein